MILNHRYWYEEKKLGAYSLFPVKCLVHSRSSINTGSQSSLVYMEVARRRLFPLLSPLTWLTQGVQRETERHLETRRREDTLPKWQVEEGGRFPWLIHQRVDTGLEWVGVYATGKEVCQPAVYAQARPKCRTYMKSIWRLETLWDNKEVILQ